MTPFGGFFGSADPVLSLHREMNRLFEDAFRGSGLPAMAGRGDPGISSMVDARMNVSESESEIRLTVELPGVSEQDVHVTLDDDTLTIRGEKKMEQKNENESFHFVERSYGTFQRSLRLPFQVNPDQVKASFQNGVLTITLPKTSQQQRSRRIEVQGETASGASQSGQTNQGSQGERKDVPTRSSPAGQKGQSQQGQKGVS